ncbi:MAG: glycosyltransferase family 4 protein [Kiritimatiellales bacterium]
MNEGKNSRPDLRRLRVLISAYACCPDHGSEPEVGWGFSQALAVYNDVWVLTRAANRERIEAELRKHPLEGIHFLYYDLPELFDWGKRGGLCIQIHYYLWQLFVVFKIWKFQREIGFDVAHHVTFAKYWAPSCLAWLNIPFVLGPVGGAEKTPPGLLSALDCWGKFLERIKFLVSRLGEFDPLVRRSVRRAALAFASTLESAERLGKMGARSVQIVTQIGVNVPTVQVRLSETPRCRFISIGRLVHWKGFLLGLRAFHESGLLDTEFWVIGDGPCRSEMEHFAVEHNLNVTFFGSLTFSETQNKLENADVLVHPSFHDSAGMVCLEAMSAGKPVICLKTGGPEGLVDDTCGVRIPVNTVRNVIDGLSEAMIRLASDSGVRYKMGYIAQERVRSTFTWQKRAEFMTDYYLELAEDGVPV